MHRKVGLETGAVGAALKLFSFAPAQFTGFVHPVLPAGWHLQPWKDVGFGGAQTGCVRWICQIWPDCGGPGEVSVARDAAYWDGQSVEHYGYDTGRRRLRHFINSFLLLIVNLYFAHCILLLIVGLYFALFLYCTVLVLLHCYFLFCTLFVFSLILHLALFFFCTLLAHYLYFSSFITYFYYLLIL